MGLKKLFFRAILTKLESVFHKQSKLNVAHFNCAHPPFNVMQCNVICPIGCHARLSFHFWKYFTFVNFLFLHFWIFMVFLFMCYDFVSCSCVVKSVHPEYKGKVKCHLRYTKYICLDLQAKTPACLFSSLSFQNWKARPRPPDAIGLRFSTSYSNACEGELCRSVSSLLSLAYKTPSILQQCITST